MAHVGTGEEREKEEERERRRGGVSMSSQGPSMARCGCWRAVEASAWFVGSLDRALK